MICYLRDGNNLSIILYAIYRMINEAIKKPTLLLVNVTVSINIVTPTFKRIINNIQYNTVFMIVCHLRHDLKVNDTILLL